MFFVTSKLATLIRLDPDSRGGLTGGRRLAYLLWPGMRPQPFLRTATAGADGPRFSGY